MQDDPIVRDGMLRPLVAGAGETGAAILTCYARNGVECAVHDPPRAAVEDISGYGIVHVCTPASAVGDVVRHCTPGTIVIVHATTLPGTCAGFNHPNLVHAPIEGRHPMLSEYLLRWSMPVSGPPAAVVAAVMQLRRAGIPARPWFGPHATTELAKHLSTLRLGMDVLFMRACVDACRAVGVDPQLAYQEWTRAYNTVYAQDGLARPVLASTPGRLGGHCVMQNAEALDAWAAQWAPSLTPWIGTLAHEGVKNWPEKQP